MNQADHYYQSLIEQVLEYGDLIETRNHPAYSLITSDLITFTQTPLVTLRKTAWKKALREMEWFLSGDPKCPAELLDWWDGQLDEEGCYICGYGQQLREFGYNCFDQISHLINGIKEHPYSRRHVITTWNPDDMNSITEFNNNPKTPTTCHMTLNIYFVRHGKLHVRTTQRSADMLLGSNHNWCQAWAMLLWLCNQTKLKPGILMWQFGDAHVYNEPSHIEVAKKIVNCNLQDRKNNCPEMVYKGDRCEFKASDFDMIGEIDSPVTEIRPKLL